MTPCGETRRIVRSESFGWVMLTWTVTLATTSFGAEVGTKTVDWIPLAGASGIGWLTVVGKLVGDPLATTAIWPGTRIRSLIAGPTE